MKKIVIVLLLIVISLSLTPIVHAKSGCCSGNGGIAYCGSQGYYVCKNNKVSPSCTCNEIDTTSYNEDKANKNLYTDKYKNDISNNSDNNSNTNIMANINRINNKVDNSNDNNNMFYIIFILIILNEVSVILYLTKRIKHTKSN